MRRIKYKINGTKTSDGAGVRLTRIIGSPELNMLDPFLLLDDYNNGMQILFFIAACVVIYNHKMNLNNFNYVKNSTHT